MQNGMPTARDMLFFKMPHEQWESKYTLDGALGSH